MPSDVAPGQLDDELIHRGRNTRRPGHDAVVGAVIRALELRDERSPCERSRGAHGEHRRLGAGAREAQTLDRGNPGPDLLGEQDLGLGRRGERRATADLGLDGVDDGRVGVTEDQRGVVAEEIAVAVAVDVAEPQTAARLDVRRVRSGVDRRPRRAARQRARRALEQLS